MPPWSHTDRPSSGPGPGGPAEQPLSPLPATTFRTHRFLLEPDGGSPTSPGCPGLATSAPASLHPSSSTSCWEHLSPQRLRALAHAVPSAGTPFLTLSGLSSPRLSRFSSASMASRSFPGPRQVHHWMAANGQGWARSPAGLRPLPHVRSVPAWSLARRILNTGRPKGLILGSALTRFLSVWLS